MEIIIVIALGILSITGWAFAGKNAGEKNLVIERYKSLLRKREEESEAKDSHTVGDHLDCLGERWEELEDRTSKIERQVDHLTKVQMLLLQDLGKEHQIQPEKDVLVTIEPLSSLKKR